MRCIENEFLIIQLLIESLEEDHDASFKPYILEF